MRNTDPATIIRWETFRAQMRRRRMDLGLRQEDVAALMDRSQDYVSNLENNPTTIPNLTTVWLWVDALGGSLTADFTEGDIKV